MTIELRKPGQVEPAAAHAPERWVRARQFVVARRVTAVAVGRKHAWTALRVAGQVGPLVVPLMLAWPWRGAGRVAHRWWRWVTDAEFATLRAHHAAAKESDLAVKVTAAHSDTLAARRTQSLIVAVLVLVVVLAWWAPTALGWAVGVAVAAGIARQLGQASAQGLAIAACAGVAAGLGAHYAAGYIPVPPTWAWITLTTGVVMLLGWLGRPIHRPLVTVRPDGVKVPALTAPVATAALCALGIAGMKDPDSIRLLQDVHRHGPGVQLDVELPGSVPATSVMDKREELAAALRRELGCVWPSVGERHPGHLRLYVADVPMVKARQPEWPLLRTGTVDLFRPVPVATDQMGKWIEITLAYCSAVIGAVPRSGKTFFLRELLLIAGLDVRAKVYGFDGKGTGDLSCCAEFAEYIGVGDEPEDIAEQLEVMRGLRDELRRRARVIRGLSREECPESKVTSPLASRRDLGLEPIVIGVDETQTWFEYGVKGNKEHKAIREEFTSICTDLAKRGPALGFIPLMATQQVNANTIPTSISNNAVIRFCLRIFGHVANDQVLGTGARKAGIDATMFAPADIGIGYLRADGAEARIVRTVFGLDAVEAEKVAKRARAARAAAGRLPAEDVEDAEVVADVAADVHAVLAEHDRHAAHHAELVEWLAARWPNQYDGLTVDELSAKLRARGVVVGQVWANGRNAKGVDLRKQDGGDQA